MTHDATGAAPDGAALAVCARCKEAKPLDEFPKGKRPGERITC